jgi:hypothetical protein
MTTRFTIGIEEEFQTVDRQTGRLCPRIENILEKGQPGCCDRLAHAADHARYPRGGACGGWCRLTT